MAWRTIHFLYRNNINKFLAVDIMKRAYEMYVFLDDYKYRIQKMIAICTEAYKEKVQSERRRDRMREFDRKAYENFWSSEEIDKKREVVRNEYHYVFCPYSFPIVEEIKEAMDDLNLKSGISDMSLISKKISSLFL